MRASSSASRDEGISLVELLIYMFLSITVLTIIAAVLINSLRAENIVRTASQATDTAQLAAQSLNRGIHNASAIEVSTPAPGLELIRTRSIDSTSAGTWRCQAWVVADGRIRTFTSNSAITPPLTSAETSAWLLLAEGVEPVDGDPYFSLATDERSVSVRFAVSNSTDVPITIDSTIVSKQPIPSTGKVTSPCF